MVLKTAFHKRVSQTGTFLFFGFAEKSRGVFPWKKARPVFPRVNIFTCFLFSGNYFCKMQQLCNIFYLNYGYR